MNFGCPGKMGPARLYQHLRENGLKVTRKEAEDLLNCWLSTFPEMKYHFNSRQPLKKDPYERYGINVEAGETVDDELDNDPFKDKRKNRQLFRAKTITGFVRNRATANAACNCDFQNPVAHLAKEALWNLECAGIGDRALAFIHDEIDYWLWPQEVKTIVPLVEQLWLEPGKRVFPDVKLKCESSLSLHWDKGGVEFPDVQWDENGCPILEEPDFVKQVKGEQK